MEPVTVWWMVHLCTWAYYSILANREEREREERQRKRAERRREDEASFREQVEKLRKEEERWLQRYRRL